MYPDLLFPGPREREAWENMDRQAYDTVAADLNIDEALSYFCGRDGEVHAAYLKYPCTDKTSAEYRMDIMSELLENIELYTAVKNAAVKLRCLKSEYFDYLNEKISLQKQYRALYLIIDWAGLVNMLEESTKSCASQGLSGLHSYVQVLSITEEIPQIASETGSLIMRFQQILKLALRINHKTGLLQVMHRDSMHESRMEKLSEKLRVIFGDAPDFSFSVVDPNPFSVLEEFIIETERREYIEEFRLLDEIAGRFCTLEDRLLDLIGLLPQLLFYIGYIELIRRLENDHVIMTRPVFSNVWMADNVSNLTMVLHFLNNNKCLSEVVQNSIKMNKNDVVIITGANQGGKSTYAKSIAVLTHFAQCGLYVSSGRCTIPWFDSLYTHFTHKEKTEEGRLQEEIKRIVNILENTAESTLVLLNESFSSTRRRDGLKIAQYYLSKFKAKGCTVLFVTHFNELIAMSKAEGKKYVCLRAEVDEENNRTYKIKECDESLISYARDIAKRCGMTYEQLKLDFEVKHN